MKIGRMPLTLLAETEQEMRFSPDAVLCLVVNLMAFLGVL